MKRTRLGNGAKSLERGSTFKHPRSQLEQTEGPKRKKRRGPKGGFSKYVEGQGCAWAGRGSIDCGGPIDAHHVIKQQRLERRFPHGAVWNRKRGEWLPLPKIATASDVELRDGVSRTATLNEILRDPRNLLAVCRNHHHAHHHSRKFSTPIDELPDECREFAVEHGLLCRLEQEYPAEAGR